MRLSFENLSRTFALLSIGLAKGVIVLEQPKLPGSVVILGEGTIVDPDKWTDFPTPPPVITNAPTPYPTPATPAPTPLDYLLLDQGTHNQCPGNMYAVVMEDCLDAGELVASGKYHFPFYLDELEADFSMPCGCFLRTKNTAGQKIIEYNNCVETTYYESQGDGKCDDGGGNLLYPSYYGQTASEAPCEAACTLVPACMAYDWSSAAYCELRFESKTIRDANQPIFGLDETYDGCGDTCNTTILQGHDEVPYELYYDDDFVRGHQISYGVGETSIYENVGSIKVNPGFTVEIYVYVSGNKYVLTEGEYRGIDMKAAWYAQNPTSSILSYYSYTRSILSYYSDGGVRYKNDQIGIVLFANSDTNKRSYGEGKFRPNYFVTYIDVKPGFTVELFHSKYFDGWLTCVLSEGQYTRDDMRDAGCDSNFIGSMNVISSAAGSTCKKKLVGVPPGAYNSNTQMICKLTESIDTAAEDLFQWDKVYGSGTEEGGPIYGSLWASNTLTGEFYIRRTCPDCTDSHKDIIYKRLTPLPTGFNVTNLFVNRWSSLSNILDEDFKLYSSMTNALADVDSWTFCNYDDSMINFPMLGFPRECGPMSPVMDQWNCALNDQGGKQNYAFYLWNGDSTDATSVAGDCVGSSPTECGCEVVNQVDYRGTLSVTASGHTCQDWDSMSPHSHAYTSTNYPNSGLEGNYCRNPDNGHEGAWCYTTNPDVLQALCDVPKCFVPPFENDWYKEYPFMPWHLPPWHITMNINPSDGNNAGWGSEIWYGEEDVGVDTRGLTEDYKDYTSNWQRDFDCIAIARHNARIIDGVKVWKMNEVKTFAQHFNSNTHNDRVVVTTGGPVQVLILDDAADIDIDPILASNGPANNLAFNWRYGNNGARVVLTDVGKWTGELSCEDCDDHDTHGLGNDFQAATADGVGSTFTYHDASIIQENCLTSWCTVQGNDKGSSFYNVREKLGNYAFYVTMSESDGSCPEFLINNGDGNSLFNAGTTLCTICDNRESPWMIDSGKDCEHAPDLMEEKCNNAPFWRENHWCQQSCFNKGKGYEGDNCCNVEDFEELGNFNCHTGYYAGWGDDADVSSMTVERCKEICLGEEHCDYFSVWPGSTCSRYNANSCEDAGTSYSPNHVSYKKLKDVV